MNLWFYITVYVIFSATGLLFIKRGMNSWRLESGVSLWKMEGLVGLLGDGRFLVGFILYVTGFLIWLYILSKHDLSIAFPIASGALYLGVLVGSVFWLHEQIGIVRIVGIFLIMAGIILVSRS